MLVLVLLCWCCGVGVVVLLLLCCCAVVVLLLCCCAVVLLCCCVVRDVVWLCCCVGVLVWWLFFDILSPVPEQVIAVPMILPHEVPPRRLCRDTQLAEQLVEVPTILYFLKQRIPEQIDDNPVPHGGRGASGGPQGFLPGHSSLKRTANKIADLPAPRSGVWRLQGFLPEQSSTATSSSSLERISERNVEQIAVSRVGEGLQDFLPGQSSSSSSHDPACGFETLE